MWRKKSWKAEKLIDGTIPREIPCRRACADIDALCGGSAGALTMMQVWRGCGSGSGALPTLSPADVCPGIFRPADIDSHTSSPA